MKTKRKSGILLLTLGLGLLALSVRGKVHADRSRTVAEGEVLQTVSLGQAGDAGAFRIRHSSCGTIVVNAREVADEGDANVRLVQDKTIALLAYEKGAVAHLVGNYDCVNQITVTSATEGQMSFKQDFCSCKDAAAAVGAFIVALPGIALLLFGGYLVYKGSSNKSGLVQPVTQVTIP